jgi:hypothetical protein
VENVVVLSSLNHDPTASTPPPAPPAPGRLTLFSLPDEILAEIFQHVHAAYQREKPGSPPLSYLLIHPRLNKLLWTIWDSVIVVPENAKAVDRFQARYTFRPSLLEHIQDLHIIMNSPCPARVVALFHRLSTVSNLKTLRIELTKAVLKSGWPPYDVILRMKSLQSCYLLGAGHGAEIKPDDSLRSVKTRLFPGAIALNGPEFLLLHITRDGPLDNHPWQTLVAFEIVLEDECQQRSSAAISARPFRTGACQGYVEACTTCSVLIRFRMLQTKSVAESQNLRRLRITLTHRSLDTASFCSKVLDCFASADLEHLELDLGSHLDLNALKIPWENLKRLTIRADWHLTSNVRCAIALFLSEPVLVRNADLKASYTEGLFSPHHPSRRVRSADCTDPRQPPLGLGRRPARRRAACQQTVALQASSGAIHLCARCRRIDQRLAAVHQRR